MFAALYRTCAAVIGYSLMISSLEDLRDGFYHLPLAEYTRSDFGVNYNGSTYVFFSFADGSVYLTVGDAGFCLCHRETG